LAALVWKHCFGPKVATLQKLPVWQHRKSSYFSDAFQPEKAIYFSIKLAARISYLTEAAILEKSA